MDQQTRQPRDRRPAERPTLPGGRERLRRNGLIAALAVVIVGVCVAAALNASGLALAVDQKTRNYVNDVALGLARDIDARLGHLSQDLELLADSMARLEAPWDQLDDLAREAEQLGFSRLVAAGPDGRALLSDGAQANLAEDAAFQQALSGEPGVSLASGQRLLYAVPIRREGRVAGVLAGLRAKENMQSLIQQEAFEGNALSCIIDPTGKVIISPTDLNLFLQLDDLFLAEQDARLLADIERMQRDMLQRRDGDIVFTAADGTQVIMVYNALDAYGWVLLTLVPTNIISAQTDAYIFRNFVILGAMILILLAALVLMRYIDWQDHRRILRVAFVDPVTGGMNNARFQQACAQLVGRARPGSYTVVSLNLVNFKLINEAFGSQRGDQTLRHILRVLEQGVGPEELAARGSGDQFFLCLREREPEAVQRRLDELVRRVNAFNDGRQTPYFLNLRQGAYRVDDPSVSVTLLQDRANLACKSAPARQGRCVFYDAMQVERMQREKTLLDLMEGSLTNGDFQVYLQPKVRASDGGVGGAEALIRWQHPQRGIIYPSDFIPLFERTGEIRKLDLYVFERVCALLARWRDAGQAVYPISVNLSRQHFADPDFLAPFERIAQRYAIEPHWLEIELTESIIFHDEQMGDVQRAIERMHRAGFLCSLDDFGAGYSSLGLLKNFDVDTIKLDRCFFLQERDDRGRAVVAAILELARQLGVKTVAEGVEYPAQVAMLREAHCDLIQGYVYAKPMPAAAFEAWARQRDPADGA
ncbi:MAG: putative bifunctional diguanylate cyclase/phosphodiesterase [Christensenellales bacterium]|jgi:diguanylate cyclase (GGDEF)-like protein